MPTPPPIPVEVLAAAKQLLRKQGPQALTMDELARETGLSRTTLYRRSGGREALLDALAEAGLPVGDRTGTRVRILQAARTVFSRIGFTSATTEEIATEANVGLATIYRQFGDKEGLAAAVVQELVPRRILRDAHPSGDLRQDLEGVAERMLSGLREDTPLVRWMMIETLQGSSFLPRVRAFAPTRTLDAIVGLLSAHFPPGSSPDPRTLAQAFAGMVMAFGFMGPLFNNLPIPDPQSTARAITELFLHGARPQERE